jgi:TFIIF-interacting CTD phosphatase-like protein
MIELLNVCYRLHMPTMESIKDKCYNMGPRDGNKKVLILDMDETMLHARFIENEAAQKADDGDFFFTLQSANSGSADVEGSPGSSLKVSIKMRPYLDMTLDYLAKFYEICVFTAGT